MAQPAPGCSEVSCPTGSNIWLHFLYVKWAIWATLKNNAYSAQKINRVQFQEGLKKNKVRKYSVYVSIAGSFTPTISRDHVPDIPQWLGRNSVMKEPSPENLARHSFKETDMYPNCFLWVNDKLHNYHVCFDLHWYSPATGNYTLCCTCCKLIPVLSCY